MCRRNPDHAEYWEFSEAGSSAGSCGSIHSNWVENRASLAFSGQVSRHYTMLELCGMDFSISLQIEHAMFWRDQGVGARPFEQEQEVMLEWPLAAPGVAAAPI